MPGGATIDRRACAVPVRLPNPVTARAVVATPGHCLLGQCGRIARRSNSPLPGRRLRCGTCLANRLEPCESFPGWSPPRSAGRADWRSPRPSRTPRSVSTRRGPSPRRWAGRATGSSCRFRSPIRPSATGCSWRRSTCIPRAPSTRIGAGRHVRGGGDGHRQRRPAARRLPRQQLRQRPLSPQRVRRLGQVQPEVLWDQRKLPARRQPAALHDGAARSARCAARCGFATPRTGSPGSPTSSCSRPSPSGPRR